MAPQYGFLITEATVRALSLAERAHHRQTDHQEIPYILHIISVAQNVPQDETHVITALLHDTLEDTAVTYDQLVHQFDENIAELVQTLTRSPHETYSAYIERCAKSPITRNVKYADIQDHLAPYRAKGMNPTLKTRYIDALCALMRAEI